MEPCMRKTAYSAEFKEQLLAKVFSPNAPNLVQLAKSSGVPYTTLYQWISLSKKRKKTKPEEISVRPKDKKPEAKFQAVFDSLQMTDEEKAAYCRKHGLYSHHLDEWKTQILGGLNPVDSKESKAEYRQLLAENKELKKELRRKDKALAEASALLILKKKADLIWGIKEED